VVARSPDAPSAEGSDVATEFDELRSLIVGPEQRELRSLRARLDDRARQARDVSQVLPEAVLLRKDDPHLTRALAPTIEEAITDSVRRNPQPLADALFPVIGPAIRKAIAATLSGMVDALNRTLEHSLSWRAVQWRITALRTGKPFAEIVLLHTLVYRVEHVLLIDRRSGLLVQHVTGPATPVQDPDLVFAMVTAIRDWVNDSFRLVDGDTLDTFKFGDLNGWIEHGPSAMLAAVFRGTAPPEFRTMLQEALERVHAQFGEALRDFNGDTAAFEPVRPMLEACLAAQYRRDEKRNPRWVWAIAAVVLVGALVWLVAAWQARARWNGYLDALRAEPGIVVVSSGRQGGKYVVSGLRDPLARDPGVLLASHRLSADAVTGRWELYQALNPALVLARARAVLRPPPGVTLRFDNGVLAAAGTATPEWILESVRMAPALAGVARFDPSGAVDATVATIGAELAASPLYFLKGSTTFAADAERAVATLVARSRTLDALAGAGGRPVRMEVVGHADADGPPASNDPLSVGRAQHVLALLQAQGLQRVELAARGAGSREPASPGSEEAAKQRNRRVSIRVDGAGAIATGEPRR
jgi:outer membrane protein OmpA-like peptidoglycan-associated protein